MGRAFPSQGAVLDALISSLNTCSNFKVRIQAASALAVAKERDTYGRHMATVWSGTLTALEGTKQQVDYRELQHQEQLREQVGAAGGHTLRFSLNSLLIGKPSFRLGGAHSFFEGS